MAGVVLAAAAISGSLAIGDSVKRSLQRQADARIGKVGVVWLGGERFFTDQLAAAARPLVPGAQGETDRETITNALFLEGTASLRKTGARVNRVQLIGVTDEFWSLSPSGEVPDRFSEEGWVGINETLAGQLAAEDSSVINVRVENPAALSREAPLSGTSEDIVPFSLRVSAVLGDEQSGAFSLRNEQITPPTVFLPLSRLQELVEQDGMANIILASEGVSLSDLRSALERSWTLEDVGLAIEPLDDGITRELTSSRVFLDDHLLQAVDLLSESSEPVLTYLAITLDHGELETPYSMVAGTDAPPGGAFPEGQAEGLIVSDWLAEDLAVEVEDEIGMSFFTVAAGRRLDTERIELPVVEIRALSENGWNESWTPNFPGILDVDSLDDWEPGIPIDRSRIRDKDDEYWDFYRATPKAFLPLATARQHFSNRFGSATAIRFVLADPTEPFLEQLRSMTSLAELGMGGRDVRAEARQGVRDSFDFGALFASMSGFLIGAAALLSGMVFVFSLSQRRREMGLLLTLGFSAGRLRKWLFIEALVLSAIGASLGLILGIGFTKSALWAMEGAWAEAASGVSFIYHVTVGSLVTAWLVAFLIGLGIVFFLARRLARLQPTELVRTSSDLGGVHGKSKLAGPLIVAVLSLAGGIACFFLPVEPGTPAEQGAFFGSGALLLTAALSAVAVLMRAYRKPKQGSMAGSLGQVLLQTGLRRKGRSLTLMIIVAAGVFLVTAIYSFRLDGSRGTERRSSGTGGFAFYAESTLPVYEDLDRQSARENFGLPEDPSVQVLSMRVSDGDDASCLNLNRAQAPTLLGVDAATLDRLGAFGFAKSLSRDEGEGADEGTPWQLLAEDISDEGTLVLPAVMDLNTATYALQLGLGDRIEYESDAGKPFSVEIVALLETSLLQGKVLVDEAKFLQAFPDSGGFQAFFIDARESESAREFADVAMRNLEDFGFSAVPASDRLNEFHAVQNTYLRIFSLLGVMGILLGTIGLAVLVVRSGLERRSEFAVMQAIGFRERSLQFLLGGEHFLYHSLGLLAGAMAALIAVAPQGGLGDIGAGIWVQLAAIWIIGGIVCFTAARLSTRQRLTSSLRAE